MKTIATAVAVCALAACGGNLRHGEARDRAVDASCDWYASCDEIGQGKFFSDRTQCETEVRNYWDRQWPGEACERNIRQEDLSLCLEAIDKSPCEIDLINSVFTQCAPAMVCQG